ncbi:MAG: DUF2062 domain-containing protein [Methylococcales bacterium]
MPKRIFQRYMPDPEMIRRHKSLQFLGDHIHDPNLWHLSRRSASKAFAIGLFVAFVPIPGQMAVAAVLAFLLRANLVISVALVWISNPLTIPPLTYFSYKIGAAIINVPVYEGFKFSVKTLVNDMAIVWEPVLLGSLVVGTALSIIGFFGVLLFWRLMVSKRWKLRSFSRKSK